MMLCKKTMILSMLGLFALSGCKPACLLAEPPSLPPVGQNMQERMELILTPSMNTQPNVSPTEGNVSSLNHL